MTRLLKAIGAAAAVVGFSSAEPGDRFVAVLDGDHVSPPVVTRAGGVANFTVVGDTALTYDVQLTRMSNVWSAGIYFTNARGEYVRAAALYVRPRTGEFSRIVAAGTLTNGDMLSGITVKQLAESMRKKAAYVQIHTAAYPDAEVRGQIMPAEEWEKKVALGRNEPLIY